MIQPKTQTDKYWVTEFTFTEADIEYIYQYFLEKEKPQNMAEITRAVMAYRVAEERSAVKKRLSGRVIYQPKKSYAIGDELVFPALQFGQAEVTGTRQGLNPEYGKFDVIVVDMDGKQREFAAGLDVEHPLNENEGLFLEPTTEVDLDDLFLRYGENVGEQISTGMKAHSEFIQLSQQWFVKGLLLDINIGHMHLAEAILEMSEGGPASAEDILTHLDLDSTYTPTVQAFSLNYALQSDDRFDEVGTRGQVRWFLRRLEPDYVQNPPERLRYEPIHYDKALLNPQLLLLERELDDEWSALKSTTPVEPVTLTLTFPHRWAGTLPLSSRTLSLFDLGNTPRQIVTFIDENTGDKVQGWIVKEGRYMAGLGDWFEANDIPIGGYIRLKKGPEPGTLMLGFDQRGPQREWIRLATAVDDQIKFELNRRRVGCGYDDQLIVGTDYVAAMDALFRRAESRQRSVASLLAELFPQLAELNPQNTVHAKTLYSAVNILRRIPPGPLFAELVRHPAFQSVGDNYWQFNSSRWQRS